MTAAEAESVARRRAWADQIREAARIEDRSEALSYAETVIRTAASMGLTDLDVAYLWAEVKNAGLNRVGLTRDVFNGLIREARPDSPPPASPSPPGPWAPHPIPTARGGWAWAEGADTEGACAKCRASGLSRGVYHAGDAEALAPMPHSHARIVERDGAGRRTGTSYLLSMGEDHAPLVVAGEAVGNGAWAPALGVVLPDDRAIREATATAIRLAAEDAPEREAVPRAVKGTIAVPPGECLPPGYLVCAESPRGAALTIWRDIAAMAAGVPPLADILGASVFAPFVGPLRRRSHALDAYGDSDRGKSTALRAAAAVWGDIRGDDDGGGSDGGGVFQKWNATENGMLRFLGRLGILPAFIDEGGMSGFTAEEWGRFLYRALGGAARLTSERLGTGNRLGLPWSGIFFVTANARIIHGLGAGKWAGIPKRVIESPAPFTPSAEFAELLDTLLPECFGHLGAEVLDRFTIADAAKFAEAAAAELPLPSGGNPRTWAGELHSHMAGAAMADAILGTGPALAAAAAEFAAAYLAEHCREPEHDADRALGRAHELTASEPGRFPTRSEYRDLMGAEFAPGSARMPIDRRIAGVWLGDRELAIFPTIWRDEIAGPLGIDEDRALRELFARGALIVTKGRRARGEWQTEVRLLPKPRRPQRVYRFALPDDDAQGDDDDDAQGEPPVPPGPETEAPAEGGGMLALAAPEPAPEAAPEAAPEPEALVWEGIAEAPAQAAPEPAPEAAPGSVGEAIAALGDAITRPAVRRAAAALTAPCPECGEPTAIGRRGEAPTRCTACVAGAVEVAYARRVAPAETPASVPLSTTPRPSGAEVREPAPWAFLVIGGGDRAYGPRGEAVPIDAGALAACRHAGDVAALAIELRTRRLWITREGRAALGLPPVLPEGDRGTREGVPHPFAEGADPGRWDVRPDAPTGLGAWMTVVPLPRTPGVDRAVAVVFPEWLDPVGGREFGALPPPELAEALTLIWQASGAHYHHSPGAWFRRLVKMSARRSRTGAPEAATLPPPFTGGGGRGARSVPLPIPGAPYSTPVELPTGWILARLDVRACYASAARSTEFGRGPFTELRPGRLDRTPGVHLVNVPADRATVHPALWSWFPAPRRGQREVRAWVDTQAALWLRECGLPLRVDLSYVWPERQGRRVFDSILTRLAGARDTLRAAPGEPAALAAAVVKAGPNAFLGGWLASDFGGERDPGDWTANRAWWLTTKTQPEVRKQRNLIPMIGAGAVIVGHERIDTVYAAAPSIEALRAMPGTGGRPAIVAKDASGGNGKFTIEAATEVTPALAAVLADIKTGTHARLAAAAEALDQAPHGAGKE